MHAYQNQKPGDAVPPPPGPLRSMNGPWPRDHTGYAAEHYPVTNALVFERPPPSLSIASIERPFHPSSSLPSANRAESAKFDAEFARLDLESRASNDKGRAPAPAQDHDMAGIDLQHADTEPSSLPSGPDVETDSALPGAAFRADSAPAAEQARREADTQQGAMNRNHALQDYATQLMLLEQQNKQRRLLILGLETTKGRSPPGTVSPADVRSHVVRQMLDEMQSAKREALERGARGESLPEAIPTTRISPLRATDPAAASALPFPEEWRSHFSAEERLAIEAEVNAEMARRERERFQQRRQQRQAGRARPQQHERPQQQEQPQQHDQPPRIGADTILPRDSAVANPDAEADALAQTAGALLDGLHTERGDKFRQSGFLALMRRLRDREVRVEGNRMVPAGQADTAPMDGDGMAEAAEAQETHPGGRNYPSDAFAGRRTTVEEVRDEAMTV